MKVWITSYALTTGIQSDNTVDYLGFNSGKLGYVFLKNYEKFAVVGKDVFYTRQEAIDRAKAMQKSKIESLKKQIARDEGLVFE